jgi:hypothetical protein
MGALMAVAVRGIMTVAGHAERARGRPRLRGRVLGPGYPDGGADEGPGARETRPVNSW